MFSFLKSLPISFGILDVNPVFLRLCLSSEFLSKALAAPGTGQVTARSPCESRVLSVCVRAHALGRLHADTSVLIMSDCAHEEGFSEKASELR